MAIFVSPNAVILLEHRKKREFSKLLYKNISVGIPLTVPLQILGKPRKGRVLVST